MRATAASPGRGGGGRTTRARGTEAPGPAGAEGRGAGGAEAEREAGARARWGPRVRACPRGEEENAGEGGAARDLVGRGGGGLLAGSAPGLEASRPTPEDWVGGRGAVFPPGGSGSRRAALPSGAGGSGEGRENSASLRGGPGLLPRGPSGDSRLAPLPPLGRPATRRASGPRESRRAGCRRLL